MMVPRRPAPEEPAPHTHANGNGNGNGATRKQFAMYILAGIIPSAIAWGVMTRQVGTLEKEVVLLREAKIERQQAEKELAVTTATKDDIQLVRDDLKVVRDDLRALDVKYDALASRIK